MRGAQENYYVQESYNGRRDVYRPYTDGIDGEQIFICLICLCVMYFMVKLFFNGLILVIIVGLTVNLVMQLLNGLNSTMTPKYSMQGRFWNRSKKMDNLYDIIYWIAVLEPVVSDLSYECVQILKSLDYTWLLLTGTESLISESIGVHIMKISQRRLLSVWLFR